MPALPPVPGVLKCFMEGSIDTDVLFPWGNVMHFRYTGSPPSDGDCVTLATAISNQWSVHMAAECPSPTSLRKVQLTDLTSATSGQGEFLGNIVGTRGDDGIPANAAMLISYASPLRYRGGHPRQYLYIGGNADFLGSAQWSTLFTAEGLAHWKLFVEGCQGLSSGGTAMSTLCAVSYISKEVNPVPPFRRAVPLVLNLDITSAASSQEIASQRRRIGRRKK